MKIECSKDTLLEVLSKTERISVKNQTMPILGCILIDATKDKISARATNLEIGMDITIPGKIQKKGIVAVPAHTIVSYINTIDKDKTVTLELVDQNLKIHSSSNTTLIKTVPHEDFPNIPQIDNPTSFSIKPTLFSESLKTVSYASAQTSMKPELSSVYIYTDDGHIVFVATDSFRLAEKKLKMKQTDEWNMLIPVKNVADIIRILDDIKDDVEILVTKHQVVFKTKDIYLTSRVVEGAFPDYRQIIPKESKTEAVVIKQDVVRAFKIATIFSDKFNRLNIRAIPSENRVEVKTNNADVGETLTNIEGTVTGDEVDINFNHRYISDCLQSIGTTSITFSFNGLGKLLVRGVGDGSFMYLVMPMNR